MSVVSRARVGGLQACHDSLPLVVVPLPTSAVKGPAVAASRSPGTTAERQSAWRHVCVHGEDQGLMLLAGRADKLGAGAAHGL
jgi:hypothetical protein